MGKSGSLAIRKLLFGIGLFLLAEASGTVLMAALAKSGLDSGVLRAVFPLLIVVVLGAMFTGLVIPSLFVSDALWLLEIQKPRRLVLGVLAAMFTLGLLAVCIFLQTMLAGEQSAHWEVGIWITLFLYFAEIEWCMGAVAIVAWIAGPPRHEALVSQ